MEKQIVVVSHQTPPRFCAGEVIAGAKAFPLDHFNAVQLEALIADRVLTVVVGNILTVDHVEAFLGETLPKAGKTAAKAKGGE